MTFAVWHQKPPFDFAPEDLEQVYQVGVVWVVTDDPARATQADVDAILNPPPVPLPSVQRDRERDLRRLEDALAEGDQGTFNSIALKLLKGDQ